MLKGRHRKMPAFSMPLADETATEQLGATLAARLHPGDVVGLQGELGSGKTTLARAILRAAAGDPDADRAQPDLHPGRGLRDAPRHLLALRPLSPRGARAGLRAGLGRGAGRGYRADRMAANGSAISCPSISASPWKWTAMAAARCSMSDRARLRAEFVARAGWADARESLLAGDASFRKYFRLRRAGGTAVVMDSPAAHEPVGPFVRIGRHLLAMKLSAPEILADRRGQRLPAAGGLGRRHFRSRARQGRR